MTSPRSLTSFRRLASTAALAAIAVVGDGASSPPLADACGWDGPIIEEISTFDPDVGDEPALPGLQYDPYVSGWGGPCDDCARTAMLADWNTYFGGLFANNEWPSVLFDATDAQLVALRAAIDAGRAGPSGFAAVTKILDGRVSLRPQASRAIEYVRFAREVEAIASLDAGVTAASAKPLVARATAGRQAAAKAKDDFLVQRYAYQQLRLAFYASDWASVVKQFDGGGAQLAKPSADLAARARYYVAGALSRRGDRARANLELARVHHASAALAGVAVQDFQPVGDADWKATLAMASSTAERIALWRVVGVKLDGLVAAQEIVKLDPTSNQLGLLLVRELTRAESATTPLWGGPPDAAAVAAQGKAFARLEAVIAPLVAPNGPAVDRKWLVQLIAGHLAARRGDLAAARPLLTAAAAAAPGNAKVAAQARASLAVALVSGGQVAGKRADELARTMLALDPSFPRRSSVTREVRQLLADRARLAGDRVQAEFLMPGSADVGLAPGQASPWTDKKFLKQMIARFGATKTPFDRFVVNDHYNKASLEAELGLRTMLDGDFAGGAKLIAKLRKPSPLGTDPFVARILDCHDCDHQTYASAPWTVVSMAKRMAELHKRAKGTGPAAAAAALELGHALYNISWFGNARVVLENSHQPSRDASAALRWYKRAYDLSKDREAKAKAALFAAKAEMAIAIAAKYGPWDQGPLPVPTTWYPILRSYADTAYHREVLRECGTYAAWNP